MKRFILVAIIIIILFIPSFGWANSEVALDYLRSLQDETGMILSYNMSAWSAMAFAANNIDVADVFIDNGKSLKTYLTTHHPNLEDLITECERQVLAFLATGVNPESVDGRNYLTEIEGRVTSGQIGNPAYLNDDIFGLLALIGAGRLASSKVIEESLEFILENQNEDGGWGYGPGQESDVDDTSAAIQALSLITENQAVNEALNTAKEYLHSKQNEDGGFPNMNGFSNLASTAWAVQAIIALGENPDNWNKGKNTPITFILSCQDEKTGGFKQLPFLNSVYPLGTAYAITALAGKSLPVMFTATEKSDGDSCSSTSECSGDYCIHNKCRSSSTYCGDGYCDIGETCFSCSADCGVCETTTEEEPRPEPENNNNTSTDEESSKEGNNPEDEEDNNPVKTELNEKKETNHNNSNVSDNQLMSLSSDNNTNQSDYLNITPKKEFKPNDNNASQKQNFPPELALETRVNSSSRAKGISTSDANSFSREKDEFSVFADLYVIALSLSLLILIIFYKRPF